MFSRHYDPGPPTWRAEDILGRLRRLLAQTGPNDDRIGHHRTYAGNTDPTKTGLALVSATEIRVRRLRLAGGRRTRTED